MGFVHSYETTGTVDGPGIRFVLFLMGCKLRCLYCHNPDSWDLSAGKKVSVDEVMAQILPYAGFLRSCGGGVTISGGEPMVQQKFLAKILRRCKEAGLHTAVDTAGFLGARMTDEAMHDTDLFLLDVKAWDPGVYKYLTGVELQPTLDFARRLADNGRATWLRFVLVPGLNDKPEDVDGLASFSADLGNIDRVDVLPYHTMGEAKWRAMGMEYKLHGTPAPSPQLINRVQEQFRAHGLFVV